MPIRIGYSQTLLAAHIAKPNHLNFRMMKLLRLFCTLIVIIAPIVLCASEPQGDAFESSMSDQQRSERRMRGPGSLGGKLEDEITGESLANQKVKIWASHGGLVGSTFTDTRGRYTFLAGHGSFFVTTSAREHQNELFDNLPCLEDEIAVCDPTKGTPIDVELEQHTPGIDFRLERLGRIGGKVVDAVAGSPIHPASVYFWDSAGNFATLTQTNATGIFETGGLLPGAYFARTNTFGAYPDELFDDLPCSSEPETCDPLSGVPILVANNVITDTVDFALGYPQGIIGEVRSESSGNPLASISIDVWRSGAVHVAATNTNNNGVFMVGLPPGTYYISTYNDLGFEEEIYDNIACPNGPALALDCDPTADT